jgi:hypothetical protein
VTRSSSPGTGDDRPTADVLAHTPSSGPLVDAYRADDERRVDRASVDAARRRAPPPDGIQYILSTELSVE